MVSLSLSHFIHSIGVMDEMGKAPFSAPAEPQILAVEYVINITPNLPNITYNTGYTTPYHKAESHSTQPPLPYKCRLFGYNLYRYLTNQPYFLVDSSLTSEVLSLGPDWVRTK